MEQNQLWRAPLVGSDFRVSDTFIQMVRGMNRQSTLVLNRELKNILRHIYCRCILNQFSGFSR